jgi:hypothetical protein
MQVLLAADADQLVALANFLQQSAPSPRIGDLYLMSQARVFVLDASIRPKMTFSRWINPLNHQISP